MSVNENQQLMAFVESFFRGHLSGARGVSPHTIRAYKDTLRLLFSYIIEFENKDVTRLNLDDIRVDIVTSFLTHLEVNRGNSPASRNYRLAAIRSFAKHLMRNDLERVAQYQRILALPAKKTCATISTYLEPEEVKLVLNQPDRSTPNGLRHYALLLFLYNTGARVNEAITVNVRDIQFSRPHQVVINGKGGKSRLCPLWNDTMLTLRNLPSIQQGRELDPLFSNRFGRPLSRDGVAYILQKYVKQAEKDLPILRQRNITPHVLRHSCAVALLQGGVDITVIRDYLGHASISTTGRYLTTNLQMKRQALDKFWEHSGLTSKQSSAWKPTTDILSFLSTL